MPAFVLTVAFAAGAAAQSVPDRPRLDSKADPNDWEAYFDLGVSNLPKLPTAASNAFYWASRLDPSRADPLFARYVAFWVSDVGRFEQYLKDDERVLQKPEVRAAESWKLQALLRNPFVPQGLMMVAYDQLSGRWRADNLTNAWIAYANGRIPDALTFFGREADHNPNEYYYLRMHRAALFVLQHRYDSAASEMTRYLGELRARDKKQTVHVYESKAMAEYGMGLLLWASGDVAGARQAQQRALVEDLSFAPAHAMLGLLMMNSGDAAGAAPELSQAVEIAPEDALYRMRYGAALLKSGRATEAVEQYRRAVAAEPYYAEAQQGLAEALEAAGDRAGAIGAYDNYVHLAPRSKAPYIDAAKARIKALGADTVMRTP